MSAEVARPGPERIDAGACPGGVIIHTYSVPIGRLLCVSSVTDADDLPTRAQIDADAVVELWSGDVCLVAFDGDSGERMLTARPPGSPVVDWEPPV